ncbi:MAG: hypothetical protein LBE08_12355 [Bifidobacteriaceae bacterium]|jgi:hypothetical protein|nr:hypothetical protein [Bifidobacteriaceae bacterium]
MTPERYPENQTMFASTNAANDAVGQTEDPAHARFADLREAILLDYTYNTARAYWGDLQDIWEWAQRRGKNVFDLTDQNQPQYRTLLRRRQYSENTIRRRMVAWGKREGAVQDVAGRDGAMQ